MVAALHHLALAVALQIHAQVLALQDHLLVLTSGDALRLSAELDPAVERQATPGRYVLISVDSDGVVRALKVGDRPFTRGIAPSEAPAALFATPPHAAGAAGAENAYVTVTLQVRVPASTPPGEAIYVSTAGGGWNANQVRCAQVDGVTWRCALQSSAGTSMAYRYTRGTWSTAETTPSGAEPPPHSLTAREGLLVRDNVARWADQH
ncbi:MAG: hypothetical protein KGM44_05190 [bacterium]|nr:hypothetical protein [bacterium]